MPQFIVTYTRIVEADSEDEAYELADDDKGGGEWEARLVTDH